jgi:hypothetical protein
VPRDALRDGDGITVSAAARKRGRNLPSGPQASRSEDTQEDDRRDVRYKTDDSDSSRRGPPVRDKKRDFATQNGSCNTDLGHRESGRRRKRPRGVHGAILVESDGHEAHHERTQALGVQPRVEASHSEWISVRDGVLGDIGRGEAIVDDGQDRGVYDGHSAETMARQEGMRPTETAAPGQGVGGVTAAAGFKARPGLDRDKEDAAAVQSLATQDGGPEELAGETATSGP